MKRRLLTRGDWQDWIDAGHPPLKRKELASAARNLARVSGHPEDEAVALAMSLRDAFTLAQEPARPPSPSHVESNPTSSRPTRSGRTAGNPPKKSGKKAKKRLKLLKRAAKLQKSLAIGEPIKPGDVPLMMAAGDAGLREMWLEQAREDNVTVGYQTDPPAPLGMNDQRYQLHREARALASARVAGNPRLDPADAYTLASQEIADRANPPVI